MGKLQGIFSKFVSPSYYWSGQSDRENEASRGHENYGYWQNYMTPDKEYWSDMGQAQDALRYGDYSLLNNLVGGTFGQGNAQQAQSTGNSLLDMMAQGQIGNGFNDILRTLLQNFEPFYNMGRR